MNINVLRYDDDTAFPISVGDYMKGGTPAGITGEGKVLPASVFGRPCVGFMLTDGGPGDVRAVATEGVLQCSGWNWKPGQLIYLDKIEGVYTQDKCEKSSVLARNQVLGIATAQDKILFRPEWTSERDLL